MGGRRGPRRVSRAASGVGGAHRGLGPQPAGRQAPAPAVPPGRLIVADRRSPLAILFGALAPGHGVTKHTTRMTLFPLQVAGVPSIHVDEALYACVSLLRSQ